MQTFWEALQSYMEYHPLRRPRFQHSEKFRLIYIDLKVPLNNKNHAKMCCEGLVSDTISIFLYSVTLFVTISNLFLSEFILIRHILVLLEWFYIYCIENLWNYHISVIYRAFRFHFCFFFLHFHYFLRKDWHTH